MSVTDGDGSAAAHGWSGLLSGRNAVLSLTLAGGVALHAVDVFIATTILPSVVKDIGGLDYYAWNTTVFMAASILGSSLSTRLLHIAGPRVAYSIATSIFTLSSLICAVAPSMPILLCGRSLQGLGGGLLLAFAYAMIRLIFPENLWPRAMAIVSGMWGVATLIGPAIGGAFAEMGNWRAAFWSLIPFSILFAVLAMVVLPKRRSEPEADAPLPVFQLVLVLGAVFALSAGSVAQGWVWNAAGIAGATSFIGLLAMVEGRNGRQLFPTGAFIPSGPLFALFATLSLLTVGETSSAVFVPLFLQVLHGQSPLAAGYFGALIGIGWTVGSFASSGAHGPEAGRFIIVAPILALIGLAALAVLVPPIGGDGWAVLAPICAALTCAGFGIGLGWPHLLTRVLQVAQPTEENIASASLTTVQLLATAMGAALVGMIANLAGLSNPGGTAGTSRAALWVFASFAAAPALAIVSAKRSARAVPTKPVL